MLSFQQHADDASSLMQTMLYAFRKEMTKCMPFGVTLMRSLVYMHLSVVYND